MLRVASGNVANGTQLSLIAAPGVRINARLKPALELSDGTVLHFDSDSLTPDSSYFLAPPRTVVPAAQDDLHGHVRASVCPAGKKVCVSVDVEI